MGTYYDLITRAAVYGSDDAYERSTEIYEWYQEVSEAYYALHPDGSNPDQFYREYARNNMISLQGGGQAGALGLDEDSWRTPWSLRPIRRSSSGSDLPITMF